jgi:hypothetical protein
MGVSPLDHPAHRPGGGRALLYGGLVRQHTRGLGPSSTRGARPPRGVVGLLPFPLARLHSGGARAVALAASWGVPRLGPRLDSGAWSPAPRTGGL